MQRETEAPESPANPGLPPPRGGAGRAVFTLLREPLVQFLLGGALIFALYGVGKSGESEGAAAPAAGSADRNIVVTQSTIDTLTSNFRLAWKREPDLHELGDLIETFVDEEVLFREGSALGLDRGDVVVRRRIVEKMSALARPPSPAPEPSVADLQAWYSRYQHRFRQAARYSFTQRFFDPKKRRDAGADAAAALDALDEESRVRQDALGGDEFVLPQRMDDKNELQVAHLYGPGFLAGLDKAPLGRWTGPVQSNFGPHAVFVVAREAARMPAFAEVEKQVRADWLTVTTRGVKPAAATLLGRYRLTIEAQGPIYDRLRTMPVIAPLLERR